MADPAEPSARDQLLKLQREIFSRLEEEVQARQRRENRTLRLYRRRYDREVRDFARVSTKQALIGAVEDSDIVYCGDFHTLRQAQKIPAKILAPILAGGRRVALALEMIPKNLENLANEFVRDAVAEDEFLVRLDYERRWGFPWPNYRRLFEFARKNRAPIVGLGSDLSDRLPLKARDDLAADFIVEATLSEPERLVFCVFGDLHVAEAHIPSRVKIRLDRYGIKRRTLIVFQNSEPIYWKLAEAGIEDKADVVEISKRKFCVLSASPWVKWQSYKSWLEDHTNLMEEGDAGSDHYHQVLEIAGEIATFLGFQPKHLEQFTVLTANDASLIDVLEDYPTGKTLIRSELVENRSCFLPDRAILYLIDLSENRAAEKAGQLVAAKLTGTGAEWAYWVEKDPKEIFYRLVLWEAIGFFGSKILNHKRKCDQYRDLAKFVGETRGQQLKGTLKDQRQVAVQLLAHRKYELQRIRTGRVSGGPRKLFRLPARQLCIGASQLGKLLAHRLYSSLVAEETSLQIVRSLFEPLGGEPRAGQDRYWTLLSEIRPDVTDRESKEDRF